MTGDPKMGKEGPKVREEDPKMWEGTLKSGLGGTLKARGGPPEVSSGVRFGAGRPFLGFFSLTAQT